MLPLPLNIAGVIFDVSVSHKRHRLWLQLLVEMHGYGFPVPAVTEIEKEPGVVVRITPPILNRDPAILIAVTVDVGDPILRLIALADLVGGVDVRKKVG